MPIESDPYGGTGGGSTTSVCTISPSDNVAIVGNIINRVSDIERFLSRIVAADVYANNLSDLAENMGNLLNGTLMMPYSPNDSWTGEGGSIAVPDDFTGTFVSGGVTTIWNDGVVTFEATPHGIVTGGGATDWLVVKPSTSSLSANKPDLSTIVYSHGTAFGTAALSEGIITINENGFYDCDVHLVVVFSAASDVKRMTVQVIGPNFSVVDQYVKYSATDASGKLTMTANFAFEGTAGDYITITFSSVTSLDLTYYASSQVNVKKLANLTAA